MFSYLSLCTQGLVIDGKTLFDFLPSGTRAPTDDFHKVAEETRDQNGDLESDGVSFKIELKPGIRDILTEYASTFPDSRLGSLSLFAFVLFRDLADVVHNVQNNSAAR